MTQTDEVIKVFSSRIVPKFNWIIASIYLSAKQDSLKCLQFNISLVFRAWARLFSRSLSCVTLLKIMVFGAHFSSFLQLQHSTTGNKKCRDLCPISTSFLIGVRRMNEKYCVSFGNKRICTQNQRAFTL